jgi:hypothetical protein
MGVNLRERNQQCACVKEAGAKPRLDISYIETSKPGDPRWGRGLEPSQQKAETPDLQGRAVRVTVAGHTQR